MIVSLDLSGNAVGDGQAGSPPAADAHDVHMFESLMERDLMGGLGQVVESVGAKSDAWRERWMSAGDGVNLGDNMSVVRAIEQQMLLSSESIRLQLTLELAGGLRTAVKTLYQQPA